MNKQNFYFYNKIADAQPHLSHVHDSDSQIHVQNTKTVYEICSNSTLKIAECPHLILIWYIYITLNTFHTLLQYSYLFLGCF